MNKKEAGLLSLTVHKTQLQMEPCPPQAYPVSAEEEEGVGFLNSPGACPVAQASGAGSDLAHVPPAQPSKC